MSKHIKMTIEFMPYTRTLLRVKGNIINHQAEMTGTKQASPGKQGCLSALLTRHYFATLLGSQSFCFFF